MSWAAHDLEPYAFQKHLGLKMAFVPLLIGSYAPDLATKWFVYGVHFFGWNAKASDPVQFHRGWPGAGFTHSLLFGVVIGLILWKGFGSKLWGLSFMLGQWAHALTDTGDTVGTMLLFPWTHHFTIGAWAYAGQTGRLTDAAAYFSGLGGMWDSRLDPVRPLQLARAHDRVLHEDHLQGGSPLLGMAAQVHRPDRTSDALPCRVLLRVLPVGGVDHLGARHSPLPLRPHLGRPALGGRGSSITPICRDFRELASC